MFSPEPTPEEAKRQSRDTKAIERLNGNRSHHSPNATTLTRQQIRNRDQRWHKRNEERRFRARLNAIMGSSAANKMRLAIRVQHEKPAA